MKRLLLWPLSPTVSCLCPPKKSTNLKEILERWGYARIFQTGGGGVYLRALSRRKVSKENKDSEFCSHRKM